MPGSDADIVVSDPSRPGRLTLPELDDGLDWSPDDGFEVPGRVRHAFARGERVGDGSFSGEGHAGPT